MSVCQEDFFREMYDSHLAYKFVLIGVSFSYVCFPKLKGFRLKIGFTIVCYDEGRLCALLKCYLFVNWNAINIWGHLIKRPTGVIYFISKW